MSLSPAEFLLVLLRECDGRINGRTLLQKRSYFIQRMVAHEFVSFNPHFYGPFAPEVDSAIGLLVELGFVKEDQMRFGADERIRYDYRLTDDGDRLANALVSSRPELAGEIRQAMQRVSGSHHLDYRQLSLAAKIAHIIDSEDRPMTAEDISSCARELGWYVSPEIVNPVAEFLECLGLVRLADPDSN